MPCLPSGGLGCISSGPAVIDSSASLVSGEAGVAVSHRRKWKHPHTEDGVRILLLPLASNVKVENKREKYSNPIHLTFPEKQGRIGRSQTQKKQHHVIAEPTA